MIGEEFECVYVGCKRIRLVGSPDGHCILHRSAAVSTGGYSKST